VPLQQQQAQQQQQKSITASDDKGDGEQDFPVFTCQVTIVEKNIVIVPEQKVTRFTK